MLEFIYVIVITRVKYLQEKVWVKFYSFRISVHGILGLSLNFAKG